MLLIIPNGLKIKTLVSTLSTTLFSLFSLFFITFNLFCLSSTTFNSLQLSFTLSTYLQSILSVLFVLIRSINNITQAKLGSLKTQATIYGLECEKEKEWINESRQRWYVSNDDYNNIVLNGKECMNDLCESWILMHKELNPDLNDNEMKTLMLGIKRTFI